MDCKRFLEEFIKIYREQPSLWQVKSKDYAKKQKSRELRIIVEQIARNPTRRHYQSMY
jgi:hypothetical protein